MDPANPRNDLVSHFIRLVTELRPSAFVLENVPAMASRQLQDDQDLVPERLRVEMARQGYDTVPASVFNASWFGIPQDRRRLIVVGTLQSIGRRQIAAPTRQVDGVPQAVEVDRLAQAEVAPRERQSRQAIREVGRAPSEDGDFAGDRRAVGGVAQLS